jgi:hypothetical protein
VRIIHPTFVHARNRDDWKTPQNDMKLWRIRFIRRRSVLIASADGFGAEIGIEFGKNNTSERWTII